MPSYLRWHLLQDGVAPYDDHDRFLKILQWQKRADVGIELAAEVRGKMERFVRENWRDKWPAHGYRLEQFGLNADGVRREFDPYRTKVVQP